MREAEPVDYMYSLYVSTCMYVYIWIYYMELVYAIVEAG